MENSNNDRLWALVKSKEKKILQSLEAKSILKELKEKLAPKGVMMKTWAKPGLM